MKYLIPIFVLMFLVLPIAAEAFTSAHPNCTQITGQNTRELCTILYRVRDIVYYFGWGIALVIITVGGIMYMTAGGDEAKTIKARKLLVAGIVGAAIILAAGFILGGIAGIIIPQTGL